MSIPNASQPFMGQPSVDNYIKKVMGNVRACQKLSADLQGLHHYKDYPGVHMAITKVTTSVTSLIRNVFSHQDIDIRLPLQGLTDQFDMIKEGNDALLERINSDIDEAAGVKRTPLDNELVDNRVRRIQAPVTNSREMVLLASRNIEKPQLSFSKKIDNSKKEPFIPLITYKPHAIKPLSILLCLDETGNEYYNHPYEFELLNWSPWHSQLCEIRPTRPLPIDETPLIFVDREEDLYNMVEALKNCSEFAVDLENHSYRSYQGLACLMQISTRTEDFIVDPFALRGKLTCLNEVFANPRITKVFHGADWDILWLQRDFGVYVVNMFDTHQAAVVLEYPQRSLAALLNKFTHITADKTFQRADWRIRPLPQDFLSYARQDSHYLLFIYDLMRNELIKNGNNLNNLINAVYGRSTDICMKRYEKPIVTPESHLDLYRRSRKLLNSRQMYALQQIYLWRDKIAREQDESVEYVLPKHMMLQMSEILPKEMQGVLACCNPIPSLVKTELLTIHNIIRSAREQKLDVVETATSEQAAAIPATSGQTSTSNDLAEVMISKHDLCNLEDSKELPTLLNPQETLLGDLFSQHKVKIQLESTSKLFGVRKNKLQIKRKRLLKKTNEYMGAYERYKVYLELKPLIEGEKKKDKYNTKRETLERVNKVRKHFLSLTNNTPKKAQAPPNKTKSTTPDTSLRVADEDILDFSGDGRKLQNQRHMERMEERPIYERGYMDPNQENSHEYNSERNEFSLDTEGSKGDYMEAEMRYRRKARENPWAPYIKNQAAQSENYVDNQYQKSQKGGTTPALDDYITSLRPNIDSLLKEMRAGVEQGMETEQSSTGSMDGQLQQARAGVEQGMGTNQSSSRGTDGRLQQMRTEVEQGMGTDQSSTVNIDGLIQQMRSAVEQGMGSKQSSSRGTDGRLQQMRAGLEQGVGIKQSSSGRFDGRLQQRRTEVEQGMGTKQSSSGRFDGRLQQRRAGVEQGMGINQSSSGRFDGRLQHMRAGVEQGMGINQSSSGRFEGRLQQMRTEVEQGMGTEQSSTVNIDGLIQQMRSGVEQGVGTRQISTGSIDGLLQQMREASIPTIESSSEEENEETSENLSMDKIKKTKQKRGNRKGPMVLKSHIKKKNKQQKRKSDEGINDISNKKVKMIEVKAEPEDYDDNMFDTHQNTSSDNDHNEGDTNVVANKKAKRVEVKAEPEDYDDNMFDTHQNTSSDNDSDNDHNEIITNPFAIKAKVVEVKVELKDYEDSNSSIANDQNEGQTADQNVGQTADQNEGQTADQNEDQTADQNESQTADQNESQTADQNEGQTADQNEGQTADQNKQSFDYEKADYSMFERKKNKKKQGQQVKEKFKGKHQKSKVMKKSGMKSFTWGNKDNKDKDSDSRGWYGKF